MSEALILTSSKEAAGMGVIDVRTGSNLCAAFKNCIADAGALCTIGSSTSSYAGYGSSGDYIAVAQSKKPCINIWQWGKPQAHFQCHIQEIVTSLVADPQGAFLFAGTLKGWIYCWELSSGELITAFQAHFKAITRLTVSRVGLPFCISVSEDGTGRAWELHKLVDVAESYKHVGRQSITPFRTWSAHTLPIKDCILFDTLTTTRVLTCSLDRTIVLYDVLQAQVCLRVTLPQSLESLACNATQDLVCAGASNGSIYLVDMTSTAIAVTAAHAHVSHHHLGIGRSAAAPSSGTGGALPAGTCVLEGHSKAVSSVRFSADNSSLVSASADGTVRVWNVWTRQCLREYSPLAKHAISNALLIPVPETLSIGVTRPTYCPLSHLSKYFKGQQSQQAGGSGGANAASHGAVGGEDAQGVVLGPSFLSRHVQARGAGSKKRTLESAAQTGAKQPSRRLSSEVVSQDAGQGDAEDHEAANSAEPEEEDYMALSGTFDAPKRAKLGSRKRRSLQQQQQEQEQQTAEEGEQVSAVEEQLSQALAQVAALQKQNSDLLSTQQHTTGRSPAKAATSPAAVSGEQGSARKKAKASPSSDKAREQAAPAVADDADMTVPEEEEEEEVIPKAFTAKDRANRRKSVAPAARGKVAEEASAEVEGSDADTQPSAGVTVSKDRANRRKSVLPGRATSALPAIDEDAPLQMPAVDAAATATAPRDRAGRRKSVSAKDLPVESSPASSSSNGAALRTPPPAEENSDLESIYSVGGTRSRVKRSVQFSGRDQVKLITPHKLPGFCESFQSGVGSAAKVAAAAAAANSAKKAVKGGKGKK